MNFLSQLVLACRPWSFTAAVVPVLVTAAVTNAPFLSSNLIRALLMGVSIQAGGNLTNTYYDFINGVDTKEHNADPTLVEKRLSPFTVLVAAVASYSVGTLAILPTIFATNSQNTAIIFSIGACLAFFYTATPVGLKYRALGDVTIFLCFGPLLMQCTSLMLTNEFSSILNVYTIPLGLLTEGILHANNARDLIADRKAGAITLAGLLGAEGSYVFYQILIYGAYLSALYISIMYHIGCLAVFITSPLALDLLSRFLAGKMDLIAEDTAKMHLPFGILLLLGVVFTGRGAKDFI